MPSNIRWTGGAASISQQHSWLFAGTWLSTETITATVGSKAVVTVTGSTSIATLLATLSAALEALTSSGYPEFFEISWSNDSTHLLAGAVTPGTPFIATLSTNSAAGTIDGGSTSLGTDTVVSSGPYDWSTAANWSGGVVPASGDTVSLDNSSDNIMFGLAQSGVTLASLSVAASFTGTVGLPQQNQVATSYSEYRLRYLSIGATLRDIGLGQGQGSGRLLMDTGSVATTLSVYATGTGLDTGLEALQIKGTSITALNALGGQMAVSGYTTDVSTVTLLRITGNAQVRCGAGLTLTTLNQSGGVIALAGACTTAVLEGGNLIVTGTGGIATLLVVPTSGQSALVSYGSTGTIGALTLAGSLDCSFDPRSRTITACSLYAGASISDPFGSISFGGVIQLVHCRLADVSMDFGSNRTVTIGGTAP